VAKSRAGTHPSARFASLTKSLPFSLTKAPAKATRRGQFLLASTAARFSTEDMTTYDYDLVVIGGGSGGVRAARMAAEFGAKVALAECDRLGGTCVNVGCIPKKLLTYGAELGREMHDARSFGWSMSNVEHSYRTLVENMDLEILRLNSIYRQLLERAGVTIFQARAELLGGHAVKVGEQVFTARYILVATGGTPHVPAVTGSERAITSDQAFALRERPERVAIVGGGYIGVEFAGIFRGLGSEVDLVLRHDGVLRGFDQDVTRGLAEELERDGIRLHRACGITSIEAPLEAEARKRQELLVNLSNGQCLEVDQVLFATGRVPRTAGLGLERAQVALGPRGAIRVDAYSKSSADHIYAVGDVTDRRALTPVAIAEGSAVARTLFHGTPTKADYDNVPSAVFSHPSVGTVGLTEAEARERFANVDIYKSNFRSLKHALTRREKRTLMKLVVDRESQRVVGLHMLGDHAGEIVQGFAVAMKLGATKADFDATVGIHPTAAEEFVTMRTRS
jgi:glutathione reductase (NADPH)